MVNILAVKRGLIALAALSLVGCSSGGEKSMASVFLGKITDRFRDGPDEPAGGGGQKLTRKLVEESGGSLIYVQLPGDKGRTLMNATSVNGPYVTFVSRFSQSVTLRGSLITGSRGFGYDLLGISTSGDDPVVRATPPQNWPKSIRRTYTFPGDGPAGRSITVKCGFGAGGETSVVIVERQHTGTLMAEACKGDGVEFRAFHLVDKAGQIWKSQQWLGPDQGLIDLDVIEPYTGE